MYSQKSFQINKNEFNYLLPVLKNKLRQSGNRYYFISNNIDDLIEMLDRLKGYYNYYDVIENMIIYNCIINSSLNSFREKYN